MRGVVSHRVAPVEQGRARVESRLHRGGQERLDGGRLGEERAAVEGDDALEVRGLRRQALRQRADEGLFVLAREEAVEAPLEADRRARLLAHPRAAAERAADVPGPDLSEVPERQQALDRGIEAPRPFLLVDREIGSRDVADEERVAGDDQPRLVAARLVGDEVRRVLGPVAGRGESGDRDVAEGHLVAVGQRLVREVDACRRRDVDRRARRLCEPALPGDVIGVVVRLEHVRDREAVLLGEPQVVLDVPLRVDHGRLAAVRDDVRSTAEILVQNLPEEHAHRS